MKIGIMPGSFNPVTLAHIQIADEATHMFALNKVIFEAAATGYWKQGLIHVRNRQDMLTLAIKDYPKLNVGYFDSSWPRHIKFYETLNYYDNLYTNSALSPDEKCQIFLIIGADMLYRLDKFIEDPEQMIDKLLEHYKVIAVTRGDIHIIDALKGCHNLTKYRDSFMFMNIDNPISSSLIRHRIRSHQGFNNFVHPDVYKYIKDNELYDRDF